MIIEYLVTVMVLYAGLILVSTPFIGLITYLGRQSDDSLLHAIYLPVAIIVLGIVLVVIPYLAHQVAKRAVYDAMTYRDGFFDTITDVLIKLSFLPLVGGLFAPKKPTCDDDK